jgi:hypothetical protein
LNVKLGHNRFLSHHLPIHYGSLPIDTACPELLTTSLREPRTNGVGTPQKTVVTERPVSPSFVTNLLSGRRSWRNVSQNLPALCTVHCIAKFGNSCLYVVTKLNCVQYIVRAFKIAYLPLAVQPRRASGRKLVLLCSVSAWYRITGVSEQSVASILRVEQQACPEDGGSTS